MTYPRAVIRYVPYAICLVFFIAYAVLSIVRHNHYQSYGYDLGINDQIVWRYSTFQNPVSTIAPYVDKTKFYEHIELIFALISPFYWIWSTRKMLLLLQVAFICFGGIAMYLLAKKRGLKEFPSLAVLIGYLGFYGVQNDIWLDVHSISFGAAFIAWFLYFLDSKKLFGTILFFLLAITAKETIASTIFAIALVYFVRRREKLTVFLMLVSAAYLFFIFFIFFPYILHSEYLYQNDNGLLSNLNPFDLFSTQEKQQTIAYSLFSFGFLPFLLPLYLIPIVAHFFKYFVVASDLTAAQGLFGQYRVMLAPLLSWATIVTIARYKWLNNRYTALYLLFCLLLTQYLLHLPLSYLSKSWFWQEPSGVKNIQFIIRNYLPNTASVVTQNNIVPHISHRDKIYELYPQKRKFEKNSPCGKIECDWFIWYDSPQFLFVDTSPEWDIRHLLANRPDFIAGINNLEKAGIVSVYKRVGSATLYGVQKDPDDYH